MASFRLSFCANTFAPFYFTASKHVHGDVVFPFDEHHPMYGNQKAPTWIALPENKNALLQLSVEFRSCLLDVLDPKHEIGWWPVGFCRFIIAEVVDHFKIGPTSNRVGLIQLDTAESVGDFRDMCLKLEFETSKFPQDGYSMPVPTQMHFGAIHIAAPRLVQLLRLFYNNSL